jgi:hypothetical protein
LNQRARQIPRERDPATLNVKHLEQDDDPTYCKTITLQDQEPSRSTVGLGG